MGMWLIKSSVVWHATYCTGTLVEDVLSGLASSLFRRLRCDSHYWESRLPLGTIAVVSGARMLMYTCIGPARPELPPHVKEGRNEAVGRPNQRSTPRRNPRSQPGARRREERSRPSEPGLFTFNYYSSLSLSIARDVQQLQLWLKCEMQFPTAVILN